MKKPPLPSNVGKKRVRSTIDGSKESFTILGEVKQIQSTDLDKAIYLQLLKFEDGRTELRLCYYIIGNKPRMAGKWAWGQYAPMMPAKDFKAIIRKATEKRWI